MKSLPICDNCETISARPRFDHSTILQINAAWLEWALDKADIEVMTKIGFSKRIFLMGFICLILAFYVWKWTENRINFYLGKVNTGLERIAQIKTKSNEVTRNHRGQLLWQDIDNGETLYIGNSIQTEKNSSTEIIFDDGEQILIGPESLVRFTRADDKVSLQLVEGKIEVKSPDIEIQKDMRLPPKKTKRLFIATPKGRLDLKNSSVKIQAKKGDTADNFKVEVVKGAPELITDSNSKEVLEVSNNTEKIDVVSVKEPPAEIIKTEETLPEPSIPEETTSFESTTVLQKIKPFPDAFETIGQREPASESLKAPKVKSIKVEASE